MTLLQGKIEGRPRDDRLRGEHLVCLLELGRKIDGGADHRDLKTVTVADRTEYDRPRRYGKADAAGRQQAKVWLIMPCLGILQHSVHRAQCVCCIAVRRAHRAEGRHDPVAHEFVDDAAVGLDDWHDPALVRG